MAENEYLEPKRFDLSEINNGKKYKQGDGIQPDAINAPLEAAAYILGLGENPDISEIDGTGEPSVTISSYDGNNPAPAQLIFKNLKGRSFYVLNSSFGPTITGTTIINYSTTIPYDITSSTSIIKNGIPKVGENILGFANLAATTNTVDLNNPKKYICVYTVTNVTKNIVDGAPSKTSGTITATITAGFEVSQFPSLSLLRPFINFDSTIWQENQTVSISRNLFNRPPKTDEAVFAFVELANQTDILFVLFRVTQVGTSYVTLESSYSIGIKGNTGNGIQAVTLTEEKGLDFTMTDGTHLYTSSVQGENGAGFYITTSPISLSINSTLTISLSTIQYTANITPKVNDIIFSISSASNGYFGKIVAINTTNSTCTVLTIANFANEINSLTLNVNGEETIFDGSNPKTVNIDYSNKNLLINPDFKINQRESTTYTYSGAASYTVDRWTFDSASYTSSTLTPNTGSGMTLYNAISSVHIVQYIETPLELSTQYTISANSPTGTVKATFTTPSALPTSTTNYVRLLVSGSSGTTVGQLNVRYHATKGYWCVRIATEVGETLTLNWVKLEKGAIATSFVTPEPTTELLKCQRYYYQTKTGNNYGVLSPVGWMQSATQFRVLYELPTTLMKEPTVLINGNVTVSFGSGTTKLTVTSTGKQHWHGDKQILIITTSEGTKDATGCYLQANNDTTAHIAFDAEI